MTLAPSRLADATESSVEPLSVTTISTSTLGHGLAWMLRRHRVSRSASSLTGITKDTIEVWKVTALDGELHTFHVHDVQFQVLSRNGRPPPPELSGWKDTVLVRRGERYRLIMRFADYADPATPYMFHCHVLKHEDSGMMGQFVVIEPGQIPKLSPEHADHD